MILYSLGYLILYYNLLGIICKKKMGLFYAAVIFYDKYIDLTNF